MDAHPLAITTAPMTNRRLIRIVARLKATLGKLRAGGRILMRDAAGSRAND
jgi:hypothetical protein